MVGIRFFSLGVFLWLLALFGGEMGERGRLRERLLWFCFGYCLL